MTAALTLFRARIVDLVIAVSVTAMTLVAAFTGDHDNAHFDLLAYAAMLISGVALATSRHYPVLALMVTAISALIYNGLGFPVAAVAYLFAVYFAVRLGRRLITLVVSVCLIALLPVAIMQSPDGGSLREAASQGRDILQIAWLIAAAAAGEALRQALQRIDEAERSREEAARLRVTEERLRIARELHDSLTHQISIVKVQAEVAVHLARRRDEEVPDSLLAIQEAAREANRELRATLEAMHDDASMLPRGLADVETLVERSRGIGLEATLTVEGQPIRIPASVDQAAYRIIQESLTNVARHANATAATVTITYKPNHVELCIEDDGNAKPDAAITPGFGLRNMHQRAASVNGLLRAEARNDGGFRVHAELPLEKEA
jgi:signal transduction histidine kinase